MHATHRRLKRFTRRALGLTLAVGLVVALSQCGGDECDPADPNCGAGEPLSIPGQYQTDNCVKTVERTSSLADLSSSISPTDCDNNNVDPGVRGYFETWHIFADRTDILNFSAQSDFDNKMQLLLATGTTDTSVTTQLVKQSDDRDADDNGAHISETLQSGNDYLLRIFSLSDGQTGSYRIEISRVSEEEPPPPTGAVRVTVSTRGDTTTTYRVTLNGTKERDIGPNGTVTFSDLIPDQVGVQLTDLGSCTVTGSNSQTVTVSANQTVTASFEVDCPTAPILTSIREEHSTLNNCPVDTSRMGTTFWIVVGYSDANGDIESGFTKAYLDYVFNPGGNSGSAQFDDPVVSGDGFSGELRYDVCIYFWDDDSIDITTWIDDRAGNSSNALSINIPKPNGANQPTGTGSRLGRTPQD